MDLRAKAFMQAFALLKASGIEYWVRSPEGEIFTNTTLIEKPVHEEPHKPKRCHSGIKYLPLYKEKLDSMQPSDVAVIDCPEGYDIDVLRGSAIAHGIRKFGKGSMLSTVNKIASRVELLRVV